MGGNILAGLILQDLPDCPDALSGAPYDAAACTEAAHLQRRRMSRQSAAEKCSRCRAMLSPASTRRRSGTAERSTGHRPENHTEKLAQPGFNRPHAAQPVAARCYFCIAAATR